MNHKIKDFIEEKANKDNKISYIKQEDLKSDFPECDYDILHIDFGESISDGKHFGNGNLKYMSIVDELNRILHTLNEENTSEIRRVLIVPQGKNLKKFTLILNLFKEINKDFKFSNKNSKKFTKDNFNNFLNKYEFITPLALEGCDFDNDLNFKIINGDVDFPHDEFYTKESEKKSKIIIEDKNRYNYGYDVLSKTFFFTVSLKEMIKLYENNYKNIFDLNIRSGLASAGKNFQGSLKEDFFETISKNPEHFYIKNNGITILIPNDIEINQSEKDFEITLENPQIINGAQTISFLSLLYYESDSKLDMDKVYLPVRIFSSTDKSIGEEVTMSLNTQNPVSSLELAYFSDEVKKIKKYLSSNGINLIKRGESNINAILLEDFIKYYFAIILLNPSKARNSARNTLANSIQLNENDNDDITNYNFLNNELFLINDDIEDEIETTIYNNFVSIYSRLSKYKDKKIPSNIKAGLEYDKFSENTKRRVEAFISYGFFSFISIYALICFNIIEITDNDLLQFNNKKLEKLGEICVGDNGIFSKVSLEDTDEVLKKLINHYINISEKKPNDIFLTKSEDYKKAAKIFKIKKNTDNQYVINKESVIAQIIGIEN